MKAKIDTIYDNKILNFYESPKKLFFTQKAVNLGKKNKLKSIYDLEPKISVIIPVYNVEKWISKCLNSLIGQTLKELEFICVDDGSTDKSSVILENFKTKDNRFIIIHQKNMGVSSARNTGIEIAKGKYISFIDSDDYLHPKTYEYSYHYAILDNIDFLAFGKKKFRDGKDDFNPKKINLSDGKVLTQENIDATKFEWLGIYKASMLKKYKFRLCKKA